MSHPAPHPRDRRRPRPPPAPAAPAGRTGSSIVGGGFGGLYAAHAPAQGARRGHPDRPPQLPPLPAAALPGRHRRAVAGQHRRPAARACCSGSATPRVLLGEVTDFDLPPASRRSLGGRAAAVGYDSLIVAAGARHHYFGHPEWEQLAPGLKTIEDATEIRRRVLAGLRAGRASDDPDGARALLTFVVVGGGPTGVELAGPSAEMAHAHAAQQLPPHRPGRAPAILLLEAGDRILPRFPPKLSAKAARAARAAGRDGADGHAR